MEKYEYGINDLMYSIFISYIIPVRTGNILSDTVYYYINIVIGSRHRRRHKPLNARLNAHCRRKRYIGSRSWARAYSYPYSST